MYPPAPLVFVPVFPWPIITQANVPGLRSGTSTVADIVTDWPVYARKSQVNDLHPAPGLAEKLLTLNLNFFLEESRTLCVPVHPPWDGVSVV